MVFSLAESDPFDALLDLFRHQKADVLVGRDHVGREMARPHLRLLGVRRSPPESPVVTWRLLVEQQIVYGEEKCSRRTLRLPSRCRQ